MADFAELERLRAELLGSIDTHEQLLNDSKKLMAAQEASEGAQYTLFASGIQNGGRDVELQDKNYTTDIAIVFDVVTNHTYSRKVDKTSYATEKKVMYSDHAVIQDGKFSFTGKVNSSPTYTTKNNYIDKDVDPENYVESRRPEKALEVLEKIISERKLITLVTEDKIIENYILTSMNATRSADEGASLTFDLEFEEFRTFSLNKTALATVYSDPKKSGKTRQKGAVQSSSTDDEIEVTARRTVYSGSGKDGWQSFADSIGVGDYTKKDQVIGTLQPGGNIKTPDGSLIDYSKAVGGK